MTCMTLFAQPVAMATTQLVREIQHKSLRMSWVVVTDERGQRRLRMRWVVVQDC
jgi:hypothetical protein